MVHVTSAIRWGIGVWCVIAVALVGASLFLGARPLSTGLIVVLCALPLAVVAALVGFRAEARTGAQVLYGDRPADRR